MTEQNKEKKKAKVERNIRYVCRCGVSSNSNSWLISASLQFLGCHRTFIAPIFNI